jgi:hypothetical protein
MTVRKGLALGLAGAVLALSMGLFASSTASAGQGPVISVSTVSATVGSTVDVQLRALNIPAPGLGAWEIMVNYNPDVINVVTCTTAATNVCNPDFAPDQVFVVGADASGRIGDSTLSTITFRCVDEGASDLTLAVDRFADATVGEPVGIDFAIQLGRVTCSEPSDIPTPRRPRPRATEEDEDEEPVATATPSGGVNGLPKVGGGASGDGGAGWTMAALAGAGLVTVAGYGALRLRARRASSGGRGSN